MLHTSPCRCRSDILFITLRKRTIHHAARGARVLLFMREQRRMDGRQGGVSKPLLWLGFA